MDRMLTPLWGARRTVRAMPEHVAEWSEQRLGHHRDGLRGSSGRWKPERRITAHMNNITDARPPQRKVLHTGCQ